MQDKLFVTGQYTAGGHNIFSEGHNKKIYRDNNKTAEQKYKLLSEKEKKKSMMLFVAKTILVMSPGDIHIQLFLGRVITIHKLFTCFGI